MITILIIGGWLCSAALAYVLLKSTLDPGVYGWSVGDRRVCLMLSIALGPGAVLSALLIHLFIRLANSDDPARW